MRKFLLEKMTRPVLYIPTLFKNKRGKRLYIPLDGIAIMMFTGFSSSAILSFFVSLGWSIPFVIAIFLFIVLSIYFKVYPRQWHEMNDYEKVGYVNFNGTSNLTNEQVNEYANALMNILHETDN